MNKRFNPVVMAGGVGSRLWPLSKPSYPKQYQTLVENKDDYTMLQLTYSRLRKLNLGMSQLICNQDHRFMAAEQCRKANIDTQILLEPIGRNTAPALIIAALRLLEEENDEPMLVLSADHVITDEPKFRATLFNAHELAVLGNIVTLGVSPSFACTGYGYIAYGDKIKNGFYVNKFEEKPDLITAEKYLKQGNYLWNSGMFILRPSVLIDEAKLYHPELLNHCILAVKAIKNDQDFLRLPKQEFSVCQSISIDYAIMEKTKKSVVVPLDCLWSDVGDLRALWEINQKNDKGNVILGETLVIDSHNCLVKANNRLVTVLGVEGLAVIETDDAVLVVPLNKTQQVKDVVESLQKRN